jgi:hypothetical protein
MLASAFWHFTDPDEFTARVRATNMELAITGPDVLHQRRSASICTVFSDSNRQRAPGVAVKQCRRGVPAADVVLATNQRKRAASICRLQKRHQWR